MSRTSFTVDNYLSAAQSMTQPLTIALWVNENSTANAPIAGTMTSGSANDRFGVAIGATPVWAAAANQAGTSSVAVGGTVTTGTWYHLVGLFSSTVMRKIYVNGVEVGENTVSRTVTSNSLVIGVNHNTTGRLALNGLVAEMGYWSAALTESEIVSLSKGWPCEMIRPQSLISAPRLIADVNDRYRTWTKVGTGGAAGAHPRMIG